MAIHTQRIDSFFTPLVGTPEQTTTFKAALAEHIDRGTAVDANPYYSLERGVRILAKQNISKQRQADTVTEGLVGEWDRIESNFPSGTVTYIAAIGAMDRLYQRHAAGSDIAQYRSTVAGSFSSVARYIHRAAFLDNEAGNKTVHAFLAGLDPRDPDLAMHLNEQLLERPVYPPPTRIEDSLTAIPIAGQLHLTPRYHRQAVAASENMCPAAPARVMGEEGPSPAILTMLVAIGDVAIDNILAYNFPIDPSR